MKICHVIIKLTAVGDNHSPCIQVSYCSIILLEKIHSYYLQTT